MRYLLPYAFARSAELLLGESGGRLTLWVSGRSQRQALAEVMRCHGSGAMPLELEHLIKDLVEVEEFGLGGVQEVEQVQQVELAVALVELELLRL